MFHPRNVVLRAALIAVSALLAGLVSTSAAATLTPTPQGTGAGFVLTHFVTIDPGGSANTGPFGVAVAANGNVLVSHYANDTRYAFKDTDGQTVANALNAVSPSGTQSIAYAHVGGQAWRRLPAIRAV